MAPGRVAANGHGEPRCGGGISHTQAPVELVRRDISRKLGWSQTPPAPSQPLNRAAVAPYCPQRGRGGQTMQLTRVLREGFIAGLIGAAAVALWFLLVDVIAGRPFFTPAMLGSAVFWGVHNPSMVVIEYSRIIGYTMIHVSAFIIVGTIATMEG